MNPRNLQLGVPGGRPEKEPEERKVSIGPFRVAPDLAAKFKKQAEEKWGEGTRIIEEALRDYFKKSS